MLSPSPSAQPAPARSCFVFGIGGPAVAVQDRVGDGLAVDRVGDGLAHLEVAGHVVADGRAVCGGLAGVGLHGQGEAAVVRRADGLDAVAGHLLGERGAGVGHVHLPGLDRGQGGVLAHEDDGHVLNGRRAAVVVLVGHKDDLLLGPPLDELVRAGADGAAAVVLAVGVLRHDADGGQGVEEDGGRLREGDDHGGLVHGLGGDHVAQVHGPLGGLGRLQRKGDVLGGDLLPVGEVGVVAQGEGPGQAVLGEGVVRGQVVFKVEVRGVAHERALHDGRIAVAPALGGVERLGFGADGDDDAVPRARGRSGRALRGAAGRGGRQQDERQEQDKGVFCVHGVLSFSLQGGFARKRKKRRPTSPLRGMRMPS